MKWGFVRAGRWRSRGPPSLQHALPSCKSGWPQAKGALHLYLSVHRPVQLSLHIPWHCVGTPQIAAASGKVAMTERRTKNTLYCLRWIARSTAEKSRSPAP